MTHPLLQLENVSVIKHQNDVLKDVTLALNAGEHVTVIGPNGAGKTSLLRAIIGLEKLSTGVIHKKPALRIGYMPQKSIINPLLPLTVELMLFLGRKHKRTEYHYRIIERCGLMSLLNTSIHRLSGGQLQRVMLARALMNSPELLLLDEPGQSLDVSGQLQLYALIRDIQQEQQCAILMVSHDLHVVMRSTDQVLCLYKHVCCSGKPKQIVSNQAFTELFGEEAKTMIGMYVHEHEHTHDDISGDTV
jgi:zinc transport system ATP-binding protein